MVPRKQYRLWYISSEDIFYPVSDTSCKPDSCKQDKVVQATSISIGYIYNLSFLILPLEQAQGVITELGKPNPSELLDLSLKLLALKSAGLTAPDNRNYFQAIALLHLRLGPKLSVQNFAVILYCHQAGIKT